MDQRHNNGAAGSAATNANLNNKFEGKSTKPTVPSKPQHLQGPAQASSVGSVSKDVVTPKGWSRQSKFTFSSADEKLGAIEEKPRAYSESKFTQQYRRVPKVTQKQNSVKQYSSVHKRTEETTSEHKEVTTTTKVETTYEFAEIEEERSVKKDGFRSKKTKSNSLLTEEDQQKGFGSLKRMWSQKSRESSSPQGSPIMQPRRPTERTSDSKPGDSTGSNETSSDHEPLSRSASSSSTNSVRTASFKDRKVVWHYVTAHSPTEILADALPSKIELNEGPSISQESARNKKLHRILAPKPFKAASFDDDSYTMQSVKPKLMASPERKVVTSDRLPIANPRQPQNEISSNENSGTSSGEADDPDEVEMRKARKRGAWVTRFDSRGNKYKVNPRSGEVMYMDDDNAENKGKDEVKKSETGTDVRYRRQKSSESSLEETPPPLLPRESTARGRTRGFVVPPSVNNMRNSMTSGSMYASRKPRLSGTTVSPNTAVPPPLLPRGPPPSMPPTQDYTPMSANVQDLTFHDKGSVSSTGSLNSFLDQAAYEPMNVADGSYEPMEPKFDEETFPDYSAAIDPPKQKASTPEYHEIDPDPDVPISASPGMPPPPAQEPPLLPNGAKSSTRSSIPTAPASPPPLPPMNVRQKRLNYIDVEVGGSVGVYGGAGAIRGKSQKTNYTEVVVSGGVAKDDGDPKKGKSVKEKLLSMLSSKQPDGYQSEGDVISSSKHDDDRTTDFAKERNKLKRLSGRLLRKHKHKSRANNRQLSNEIESSTQSEIATTSHDGAAVSVYGSATNLTATSSESSRSLSQVASSNSGSSGDGQARPNMGSQVKMRQPSKENRRQSYEPPPSQVPPKLHEKSRSEMMLNSSMMYLKSQNSTENTPTQGFQAQRTGKDVGGSPIISAPRVQSHLHQQQRGPRPRNQPTSPRPVSEPPVMDSDHLDPNKRSFSMSHEQDPTKRSPRHSRSHDMIKVLPMPVIKDSNVEIHVESGEVSPNLPSGAPPPPPPIEQLTRPPPPTESPPELPPAPMRDLKPDRFKKRVFSGAFDAAEYSAADEIPRPRSSNIENNGSPIYDDVEPGMTITPRRLPLSSSAKSKLLESEPLYQVYRSRTLSHASMKVRQNPEQRRRVKTTPPQRKSDSYDAEWRSDLMTEDAGATTLWKEVKEVLESGVGKDLSKDEMKLQQAQFEVVTSQASYMRSLNILIDHFMNDSAMQDPEILPKQQRKELFSNIVAVREVEQRFLQEIEQHFWDKLYLTDIADITAKFAVSDFEVYVRYIQNQVYQDRVLTDLQRNNDKFAGELGRLESSPECNKLQLLSFLLLPMQRVTRLPLLISAIVNQADSAGDKDAYNKAKQALGIVNKLVKRCNEGARKMQQTEQLAEIAKELAFAPKVKTYALVSQSRSVVKKGEMSVVMSQDNRKPKALKLWLFLFSDVLLLARKKNMFEAGTNVKYEVIDWAKRAMLYVNERAVSDTEIFLVLLENHNGKRVELALTPVSINEMSRWTDALNPQRASESEESIYESWDCPQYHCIIPYTAIQPDELTLDVGDVMRVLKKTGDGWLEGERLRDNELGWFPAENCEEIEDEHVRARNLRNLYRIIPAGGSIQE